LNPWILFLCDDINSKELHSLHHYRHPPPFFLPSHPHTQELARLEAPRATQPAGGVGDDILRLRLPRAETLVQGPRSSEGSGLIASFNPSDAIAAEANAHPLAVAHTDVNGSPSNNPYNPYNPNKLSTLSVCVCVRVYIYRLIY